MQSIINDDPISLKGTYIEGTEKPLILNNKLVFCYIYYLLRANMIIRNFI